MKYLADTHIHSIFSYDGQMLLEEMIKKGISLGLKYMAFTEHLEFSQISLKQALNRYKLYYQELEKLQDKYPDITLLKGVEFSNPEKYPDELEEINKIDIDFIIGSNHLLPKNDSQEEILKYYKRILEMVKKGGFDSLGHLDYLKRKYDDSCISDDIIREIFFYLVKNNIALEINSSAARRLNTDSFPSKNKLDLYKNCGGSKVTIGSDAHRLNEIYDSISKLDDTYKFNKGVYVKRKFLSLNIDS